MKKTCLLALTLGLLASADAYASSANCRGLPGEEELQDAMRAAANPANGGPVGGLFEGTRMWGAVVNRDGEICGYVTTTRDPKQVWPGSQAIAKAKAYTANAFSLDAADGGFPLSTARLYTFTQPGHSLWSLGQSNLWNPDLTAPPAGREAARIASAAG